MKIKCARYNCSNFVRQESRRPNHTSSNGVTWRPYCEIHLAQQISKYDLEIRPVGNKTRSAIATLEADAPAVNVTHLVFQTFRNNSVVPLHQQEIKVAPGQVGVRAAFHFPVGTEADNTYDLQVFARNITNIEHFRDGFVVQILNYVIGTDRPSVVTVGAGALILTDYSFTFPMIPLNFSVVASEFVTAGQQH